MIIKIKTVRIIRLLLKASFKLWLYKYYIIITFCSEWSGILSHQGKVLLPEAKPRATVPSQGGIICHITLNKIWQLFYYIILWTVAIWQFTVQSCTWRFLPCDITCDSSYYHMTTYLISFISTIIAPGLMSVSYHPPGLISMSYHTPTSPGWYRCFFFCLFAFLLFIFLFCRINFPAFFPDVTLQR